MKGFVFTFSAVLLFSLALMFSAFYFSLKERDSGAMLEISRAMTLAYIADDMESDLNEIIGMDIDANSAGPSSVKVSMRLPGDFNIADAASWQDFLGSYHGQEPFNASVDINGITGGSVTARLSENLRLEKLYGVNRAATFYSASGQTGMNRLDINIHVPATSTGYTAWAFNPSGDINVNFNYSDNNSGNTVSVSGKLLSTQLREYEFEYAQGGSLKIQAGNIDSNSGAVRIINDIYDFTTKAKIDLFMGFGSQLEGLSPHFDADLNISIGDANISRKAFAGAH